LALNVVFTDDVDYSVTADETVELELDGVRYEIDLSRCNAMRLRDDLEPWINAARRTGGRRLRRSSSDSLGQETVAADRRAAIRRWARYNGYGVAVFGRIPRKVLEAYTAAVDGR
jgi:hypothetical protein